jgi:hypothetical protein
MLLVVEQRPDLMLLSSAPTRTVKGVTCIVSCTWHAPSRLSESRRSRTAAGKLCSWQMVASPNNEIDMTRATMQVLHIWACACNDAE